MLKYEVAVQSKVDPDMWLAYYRSRFLLFCVLYMITHFKPSEWLSDAIIIRDLLDEEN